MEKVKSTQAKQIETFMAYCKEQENFLQAKVMIIKLQQAKIERLKKNNGNETDDEKIKDLEEKVKLLTYANEHHPLVLKFAVENNDLRDTIQGKTLFSLLFLPLNFSPYVLAYQNAFGEELSEYQNEITQYRGFFAELAERNLKLINEKKMLLNAMKDNKNSMYQLTRKNEIF